MDHNGFDALGRATTVTTPDNAVVKTSYSGNTVTVTDQAGKKRRSLTDGLGRLVRVDEPDANNNLDSGGLPVQPTNYSYDVLGNLTTVTQGTQQRVFYVRFAQAPDAGANPEERGEPHSVPTADQVIANSQMQMENLYDANSNLLEDGCARRLAHFSYDALNRQNELLKIKFADGPRPT